jgi:hypothetical protein
MSRMRTAPRAARMARAPRPPARATPESEERRSTGTVRGELEPEGVGRADRVKSARADLAAAGLGRLESEAQGPAGTIRGEPEGAGRADRVKSARAELAAAGLGGLEREARVASTAELLPAAMVRCRAFREKSIATVLSGEVAWAAPVLVLPRFGKVTTATPFSRRAAAKGTAPAFVVLAGARA